MDVDHLFVGQALWCHYIHEFTRIVPRSKGAYVHFSITLGKGPSSLNWKLPPEINIHAVTINKGWLWYCFLKRVFEES